MVPKRQRNRKSQRKVADRDTLADSDTMDGQVSADGYEPEFPDIEVRRDYELNPFEEGLLDQLNQYPSVPATSRQTVNTKPPSVVFGYPTSTAPFLGGSQTVPAYPVPQPADKYVSPGQILWEDEQGVTVFYRRRGKSGEHTGIE
jgi:hypothetical protein